MATAALTSLPQWKKLQAHQKKISASHLRELFENDSDRFTKFSLSAADLLVDFSKNKITAETLALLCDLAKARNLSTAIQELISGKVVNSTENRSALHTALRHSGLEQLLSKNKNISLEIAANLQKMEILTAAIRNNCWKKNPKITDIVNIGIGGSDLGPAMAVQALQAYQAKNLKLHFISNIDPAPLNALFSQLNPHHTLFIISSKSFTTQETLCNAQAVKKWFIDQTQQNNLSHNFIAITSQIDSAKKFGIDEENIFPLWDWVGGRYSLWSAVGLPIAFAIGMDKFKELLAGAHEMDSHFITAPFMQNMPVILGLLGIWNYNFFHTQAHAILPYDQSLQRLPTYLQQAEMESNGKSVTTQGEPILDYKTCPIIFGESGTNGQHAFYQLLHQGTQAFTADFIVPLTSHYPLNNHHEILVANAISQSKALMDGITAQEIEEELAAQGFNNSEIKNLLPHKLVKGDHCSNTILLNKLTPFTLGALLALYEHKIFVQSVIWDINAFDQWGVERGKQLMQNILPSLTNKQLSLNFDSSTNGLIAYFIRWYHHQAE